MATQSSLRPIADTETFLNAGKNEASTSAVSWAAVIGGAFVAASLSLILLSLGTGLGFSAVSPWTHNGSSAAAIGAGAIAWLILTQIAASALGGYLGGRLRTKWTNVHTEEVYFRDTAHGLLVWAVGMVITVGFLASAAASFAGAERTATASNSGPDSSVGGQAYFVDTLLRSNSPTAGTTEASERAEISRTFTHDLQQGAMTDGDRTYLAQLVSARTGLSPSDSDKRVTAVFSEIQDSAERARKTLAHLSLWLFVALLSGAFFASYAGTIGGKQRDHLLI
jgi:hypothetical protein